MSTSDLPCWRFEVPDLRGHFSAEGPTEREQDQPSQAEECTGKDPSQIAVAFLLAPPAQNLEASMAVIDAVDSRAAIRTDDDAAAHADADSGAIAMKMTRSHEVQ
jgi:hypothetical protein